jgi:hypothetical protein
MGETATAIHVYDKVLQIEPNNTAAKSEVIALWWHPLAL